ncbi:MAG: putative ABC transporter permease [Defluviitaleaceae bacterium]|nr:putative ABC transporter permease [Defluviitaleaceae bacterium]
MISRFIIYGALGCLVEVLWTGLGAIKNKNFKLSSNTSLWMFFIYGLAVFLEPFFRMLEGFNFLIRGFVYAGLIFAVEFVTGVLLKRANLCPWDYSHTRFNVKGVIRADYLPAWIVLGLFFEQIYWVLV